MYTFNKGINKTAEFKGVKGTFIPILLGNFMLNFIVLAILQFCNINAWISYTFAIGLFFGTFGFLFWFVKRFGEYGFWKFLAFKKQPKQIANDTISVFRQLIDTGAQADTQIDNQY
jgi:Domain of unknown function (DUF4133)